MNKYIFEYSLNSFKENFLDKIDNVISKANENVMEVVKCSRKFFTRDFLYEIEENFKRCGFKIRDFLEFELVVIKVNSTTPIAHKFYHHTDGCNYHIGVASQIFFIERSSSLKGGDLHFDDLSVKAFTRLGVVHRGDEQKNFSDLTGKGNFVYLNVIAEI